MLTQGWFCCKHCAAAATLSKGWLPVLQATAGFTHVTEHQLLCLKLQYDLSHRFAQEHADITRKSPQLLGTYCQRKENLFAVRAYHNLKQYMQIPTVPACQSHAEQSNSWCTWSAVAAVATPRTSCMCCMHMHHFFLNYYDGCTLFFR
jgi:hypothetical protein